MAENENPRWPKSKDHLNKTFLEELAHKLWNTKGVRFGASQKLLRKNSWSNLSLGFLSAYLIIYGLFSVYQISGSAILDPQVIAFGSTAISILLLVFTQFESAQDYKIRALEYHKCAIEISELHDEIRLFKTLGDKTTEDKIAFCKDLSARYQQILRAYSNHDDIDYKIFVAKNKDYYDLSVWTVIPTYMKYYFKTFFIYHLLILGPVIAFLLSFLLQI